MRHTGNRVPRGAPYDREQRDITACGRRTWRAHRRTQFGRSRVCELVHSGHRTAGLA
jgi:hypothetical protein